MRCRVLALVITLLAVASVPSANASPGPHTFLVALDPGAPADAAALVEGLGGHIVAEYGFIDTLEVRMTHEVASAVSNLPFVDHVTLDEQPQRTLATSRPAVGVGPALVNAGFDGSGVTVAVVDSGVDDGHPGLAGRISAQFTFGPDSVERSRGDKTGHGTHVAGIVAGDGSGSPDRESSGIAPGASILSLDLSPSFTTSNALRAFQWLHDHHEEHDVRVVVNSWGRERNPVQYEPNDPVVRASNALVADGIVVVFSAGNGGPEPGRMTLEAANPNVITVGATNDGGRVESYSSRGPVRAENGSQAAWYKPDVVAPGTHIVSARSDGAPGQWYVMMNGTSMSAPHVAGAAAVILSVAPELTPGQVQQVMWQTARDVGPPGPDAASGHGMVDVHAALERILAARGGATPVVDEWRHEGTVRGVGGPEALRLTETGLDSRTGFGFVVEEGAKRAAVHLNYTGRGEVTVTLTSPSGDERTHRTQASTRFILTNPDPGRWDVRVQPSGPADGRYDAHTTVLRLQSVEAQPLPPPPPRPEGGFPSTGLAGAIETVVPFAVPPLEVAVPAVGLALAAPLVAYGVMRRRRRSN